MKKGGGRGNGGVGGWRGVKLTPFPRPQEKLFSKNPALLGLKIKAMKRRQKGEEAKLTFMDLEAVVRRCSSK